MMVPSNSNPLVIAKAIMTLFDIFKNIFIILIFLQIGPIFFKSIKKQYTRYFESPTRVGVIAIKGVPYDSIPYTKKLYKLFKNPDIKALLIDMNCLGSAAGTGQIIFNEITALKKKYPKPVVVLVENICTAGGYLIACSADYIISPAAAIIGSVGSYFSSLQLKEFLKNHKVDYTGKTKADKKTPDPFADLTEKEKILIQGLQRNLYEEFTQMVAKSRKLSLTRLDEWADGKIFTGRQALKLGLIDEIGSMENAVEVIREKALIEGKIKWIKISVKNSLLDFFAGTGDNNGMSNVLSNIFTFLEGEII